MIVLGISYTGSHDSAAALVCDGELIAAAEEERFTRRKHDAGIPLLATEHCLAVAGIDMGQVDRIALADLPYRFGRDSYVADMEWRFVFERLERGPGTWRHLVHRAFAGAVRGMGLPLNVGPNLAFCELLEAFGARFGTLPEITFHEHHRAHAASTFLTAGVDDATVVTCDGVGGPYSSVVWRARGTGLRRTHAEMHPNSLGNFYEDVTRFLGLGNWGEGKTMGLAPYGDPEPFRVAFDRLVPTDEARWYRYDRLPLDSLLGVASRSDQPIMAGPYVDIAAAAQRKLEVALLRILSTAVPSDLPLCLSGGVALNCSANGVLRRSRPGQETWVFPATGDGGLSVGAALLVAAQAGELRPRRLADAYLGPEHPHHELESALAAEPRFRFHRSADVAGETADLLARGKVVGWFQGRMEFGPRALGNRSILADPRSLELRDFVNRLKGREHWRPLAPSVLLHRAHDYFDLEGESPFMLFATNVRPERRAEVPAIVHVDGSARPQTVSPTQNPRYHALLAAFERRTGVPILMNTSFNGDWEPIVASPRDAVRTAIACGLDVLVLGDLIAERDDIPAGVRPGTERPTIG